MKSSVVTCVAVIAVFAGTQLTADDLFFQMRVERTRRCIPNYNYRAGQSAAVSAVVSEPAILFVVPARVEQNFLATETFADFPESQIPTLPATETTRAFVFNDVVAGPMILSGLGAKTNLNGQILVTGILNHTGGDTGQLLGGRAVIRVEPLTATGTTAQNSTALAVREVTCWVRRNEPETVQICVQYPTHHNGGFGDVERVRVFLEYHPNR